MRATLTIDAQVPAGFLHDSGVLLVSADRDLARFGGLHWRQLGD
jgi:hypothetical protein